MSLASGLANVNRPGQRDREYTRARDRTTSGSA